MHDDKVNPAEKANKEITPVTGSTLYQALMALWPARVLLAEDDADMRGLLASTLRKDGYEVIEAKDGVELLHLVEKEVLHSKNGPAVNLIISDMRMPGQTGIEVLTDLRKAKGATPFILITAFGDKGMHEEARRLGATAVFNKPFDFDDLRTAVINLLRLPL